MATTVSLYGPNGKMRDWQNVSKLEECEDGELEFIDAAGIKVTVYPGSLALIITTDQYRK